MDLMKFFYISADKQVIVNVQGTEDDPLFQANQIGDLLGLKNIRESIRDFDSDEKVVILADTPGGRQSISFLSEIGLYRLLGQSRTAIARPFQKWVAMVVKEIRLKGRYDLQEAAARAVANTATIQLALESERETTALAIADAAASKAALESEREAAAATAAELERFRTKRYEEVAKLDHAYIFKEIAEMANEIHKIGKAKDVTTRLNQLNTGSAQGIIKLYERTTHYAPVVEAIVKIVMKRYHFKSMGGCEHYNSFVEHSRDVIDIASVVIDTLASSYEFIDRMVLFDKVVEKLRAAALEKWTNPLKLYDAAPDTDAQVIANPLIAFLEMDEGERGFKVENVEGAITTVHDFKVAFEGRMAGYKLESQHADTFEQLGYKLSAKPENVCKSCNQLSKAGCCPMYNTTNRGKKKVIHNMRIEIV